MKGMTIMLPGSNLESKFALSNFIERGHYQMILKWKKRNFLTDYGGVTQHKICKVSHYGHCFFFSSKTFQYFILGNITNYFCGSSME